MKKKKIFVVGAVGLFGKYFCKNLKKNKNYSIFSSDISIKKDTKNNFKIDITNEDLVEEVFLKLKKNFGKIDCLINLAGFTSNQSMIQKNMFKNEYFNSSLWKKAIDINLTGTFNCIKYFMKHHNDNNKFQKIIIFGSIYGSSSPRHEIYINEKFYTQIGYSASKAGLIGLNKWISRKFSNKKIISNIISPAGVFNTNKLGRKFFIKYIKNIPQGKISKPNDIFGLLNFLIDDSSNYITGQNIHIDGGFST